MDLELIISAIFHVLQAIKVFNSDFNGDSGLMLNIVFLVFEIAILLTMFAKNYKTYKTLEFIYGLVYLGLLFIVFAYGEIPSLFNIFSKVIYPFIMYFKINKYLKEQE